ncbi:MAG: SDR family NAD(P)-dependent oxidoreductase [Acidimicrobiia bacterium]|nr:SDR family NAD(P)-dependent oxidoreductase [Acidimicrobiia bacterium]
MLHGRRIVVTGASSGIGQGLAGAFVDAGATVWGVGRDPEALAETARHHPGMSTVAADLTTTAGRRAVATAIDHGGSRLDVVVHAAGLLGAPGTTLDAYPEREWREVFDVNLTAVQFLHRELVPALERGDTPTVIAMASTVGRLPRPGWGAYAVSKHALEGWVALLALEWPHGRVYSVNPGGTRTPMRARAMPDEDPATLPTPADIAPLFLHLAHPQAPEPSGAILDARDWIGRNPWDGIVTALS